ncbi:MAG: M81 family metallopeptidase [Cyclobacteriaceae bacterium]
MKSLTLLLSALVFFSCSTTTEQQTAAKLKVAVIKYQHETCTFCPGGDTEIADWTKLGPPLSGEELLKSGNYIRGFVNRARSYPDIELIGITSPVDVFGGSSRSWNSKESFEHFMGKIIEELKANMPLDGVYLALHGAMAVRDIPKPEAEIAKRVRELVGPDIPIVGTFDLHGNEDGDFLAYANGAFVTKRYPHYDSYLQGERAAYFIREMIQGRYISTTASRKPPVITGTVLQWTGQSPSMDIMERGRRWEARLPDVFVSVFYGFPWSDVPDVGATVHVMTNGDQDLADSIANDMEEFIWRVREDFALGQYPMPKEAVAQVKTAIDAGRTPVVLGDYSDRPGDATWILDELIKQEVSGVLYGALTDANVLEQLEVSEAQPGDDFDMMVGGYTGDQAGGKVRIQGKLKYFGPFRGYDKTAIVEFGDGNALFITPTYEQLLYPEQMRVGGINPDDYQVFVVKSRVHFRRGFDETGYAKEVIVVDAPGDWFGTIRLDALDYQYAPIDKLYPFDGSVQ